MKWMKYTFHSLWGMKQPGIQNGWFVRVRYDCSKLFHARSLRGFCRSLCAQAWPHHLPGPMGAGPWGTRGLEATSAPASTPEIYVGAVKLGASFFLDAVISEFAHLFYFWTGLLLWISVTVSFRQKGSITSNELIVGFPGDQATTMRSIAVFFASLLHALPQLEIDYPHRCWLISSCISY